MFKKYYRISFLLLGLLASCNSNHTNSKTENTSEPQYAIKDEKDIDSSFNSFINKFISDPIFQLSRIKFPLKIKQYNVANDRDTLIYKYRADVEILDFSMQKLTEQKKKWEQKIVVDKNKTTATIEIRGIENGIITDYRFEKIDGTWMLIEINDSST